MDTRQELQLRAIDELLCEARQESDIERIDALERLRALIRRAREE
jgi:hypothetical protein